MLFLPTTLLGGILFQLIVFILARGVGISCCGNVFNDSAEMSGVFGLFDLFVDIFKRFGGAGGHAGGTFELLHKGGGGGGAGADIGGGGGGTL
jgi:hypothetical protein